MFLNPEELVELTHAKRRDTQIRALRSMGIEHRVRPDGTVAILRTHIEQVFGGAPSKTSSQKTTEPDWSAFERAKK